MLRSLATNVSIVCVFLPFLLADGARAQAPAGSTRAPSVAKSPYVQQTVRSAVLGEDRRILIRLPRHYELDAATRYPVLYKLDGDNQLARYDDSIDILHAAGSMPDMIVVAIPNASGQRNRDLTPPTLHQDSDRDQTGTGEMGRGDRFLDFIEQELIPSIDKQYRTSPQRVFAGHSRGALLVFYSLFSKPALFQARLVFSAPLMRDDRRLITEMRKFFKEHPQHASFLYLNWGEQENETMGQSHDAIKRLLTTDAPKRLRWIVERARAADHQQTPVLALPSALYRWFAGQPAARETSPKR